MLYNFLPPNDLIYVIALYARAPRKTDVLLIIQYANHTALYSRACITVHTYTHSDPSRQKAAPIYSKTIIPQMYIHTHMRIAHTLTAANAYH